LGPNEKIEHKNEPKKKAREESASNDSVATPILPTEGFVDAAREVA
jgi:hypothetical protein